MQRDLGDPPGLVCSAMRPQGGAQPGRDQRIVCCRGELVVGGREHFPRRLDLRAQVQQCPETPGDGRGQRRTLRPAPDRFERLDRAVPIADRDQRLREDGLECAVRSGVEVPDDLRHAQPIAALDEPPTAPLQQRQRSFSRPGDGALECLVEAVAPLQRRDDPLAELLCPKPLRDRVRQHRRERACAVLPRGNEQPPGLETVQLGLRRRDSERGEQVGADRGSDARDRENLLRRGILAVDQIGRELTPRRTTLQPHLIECLVPAGGLESLEPIRDQLERRRPAGRQRPALLGERLRTAAETLREHRGDLLARECEVGRVQLDQLAATARQAEPERGKLAATDHDVQPRRCLEAQRAEELAGRFVVCELIDVIEHEQQLFLSRIEAFADGSRAPFREAPPVGCADRHPRWRHAGRPGAHSYCDARSQHRDVTVGSAEAQPARAVIGGELTEGRRLPITPARDHQRHPALPRAIKQPLDSGPRDHGRISADPSRGWRDRPGRLSDSTASAPSSGRRPRRPRMWR